MVPIESYSCPVKPLQSIKYLELLLSGKVGLKAQRAHSPGQRPGYEVIYRQSVALKGQKRFIIMKGI